VDYFRSSGVWSDEYEQHNLKLIERQELLARAWTRYKETFSGSDDQFREGWLEFRANALEKEGVKAVWQK
ncbi:MAG: C4-dicarboxylate ABC transporter, partial [Gammaproteobacteria bacterium]|nr:C4-dicarboxylate ABC transporter [Gammaproteobacteria bacterium]